MSNPHPSAQQSPESTPEFSIQNPDVEITDEEVKDWLTYFWALRKRKTAAIKALTPVQSHP